MTDFLIDLGAKVRAIPDFPKEGILFRDIMPLLQDPTTLREAVDRIVESEIEQMFVTDTLPIPASATGRVHVVSVAPLLAEAITRTHKGLSISALFT